MTNTKRRFSTEQRVRLLRLHLIEKEPVSDICEQYGFKPNVFYRWQKIFFENGGAAFEKDGNKCKDSKTKKLEQEIAKLNKKIASKDEVIVEIMASHIRLKKNLGQD